MRCVWRSGIPEFGKRYCECPDPTGTIKDACLRISESKNIAVVIERHLSG